MKVDYLAFRIEGTSLSSGVAEEVEEGDKDVRDDNNEVRAIVVVAVVSFAMWCGAWRVFVSKVLSPTGPRESHSHFLHHQLLSACKYGRRRATHHVHLHVLCYCIPYR